VAEGYRSEIIPIREYERNKNLALTTETMGCVANAKKGWMRVASRRRPESWQAANEARRRERCVWRQPERGGPANEPWYKRGVEEEK